MAKLLRVSFFLFIGLLIPIHGNASHLMGGNITHTCVGKDSGLVPPSTIFDPEIVVSPQKTTIYTVEIIDANGCRSVDAVTVELLPGTIEVPNAFTPNGDQLNDEFYLITTGSVVVNYFRIYNRWDELIFESSLPGKGNGWNGTRDGEELPTGSYTYVVSWNNIETGAPDIYNGNVTLIR